MSRDKFSRTIVNFGPWKVNVVHRLSVCRLLMNHLNAIDPDSRIKKKRVIYAWNYVEWGGAQIYTLALIKEARKHFDLVAVLPKGSSKVFIQFLDEMCVKYEFFSPPSDLRPAPTLRRKIQRRWRKLISENALVNHLYHFDLKNAVVHIDLAPQQSFFTLFRLCLKANVFFTMHNSFARFSFLRELIWKLKIRALLSSGRFHIFSSNEDAKHYLSHFVSKKSIEKIRVTCAGIDSPAINEVMAADFDRSALIRRFGIAESKFVVLAVGQFVDRKGRWIFLQGASQLLRVNQDIEFVWLMPNLPDENDLARIEEYDLGESLHLVLSASVGSLRRDHWLFYRIADVFALPSYVEGLPIALLEAMGLGLPCISSNVNGIPEAIQPGETGLLIEPGNADGFAAAIQKLKDDPAMRQRLANNGRAYVLEKYDAREAAEIAVGEYKECLKEKKGK